MREGVRQTASAVAGRGGHLVGSRKVERFDGEAVGGAMHACVGTFREGVFASVCFMDLHGGADGEEAHHFDEAVVGLRRSNEAERMRLQRADRGAEQQTGV